METKCRKVKKKPQGIFRYLTPEECDNMVKAKLATNPRHVKGQVGRCWDEGELLARHQVIIDYIAQGLSRRRVVEEIMARWGIAPKTAYEYYKEAVSYMGKDNDEFVAYNRDIQRERLEGIITEALEAHQYKEATMACAELDKILGLQQTTQKVELDAVNTKFDFGE